NLTVKVDDFDVAVFDAVLLEIFRDEKRPRGADARGDGLADQIFRLFDLLARGSEVALGVAFDHADDPIVLVHSEPVADRRQVTMGHEIPLTRTERLQGGSAGRKQFKGNVQPLFPEITLAVSHLDGIIERRGADEHNQRHPFFFSPSGASYRATDSRAPE